MACNHEDIKHILDSLGKYQGSGQRHICAGCAYLLGQKHRAKGLPFNPDAIKDLPFSQAKSQRHKNAYEAYKVGYDS